jgi:starch synthase
VRAASFFESMKAAILYEPDAYTFHTKVMGRQSAGIGFLRAVAEARPEKLWSYARSATASEALQNTLAGHGASTEVTWIPFTSVGELAKPGLLYRPDPVIADEAWRRLAHVDTRAYSICGVTHSINSHGSMGGISSLITGPVESWDAVICTSTVARESVGRILDETASYMAERFAGSAPTLPQLPVIPLGVHVQDFTRTPTSRSQARVRLDIAPSDMVVLFAGRVILHGKAHPLPLFLALERAKKPSNTVLILAGISPSEQVERVFLDEAARFCPSVRIVRVQGSDNELYAAAWQAADVFASLSDSIQETFGLTPVEAMAAGLPVVVSDWDGYKDTVRDDIEGFRVPTLTLPAGFGGVLADRYDLGVDNYDMFCGLAAQMVAVDTDSATMAFSRLFESPELRARMGDAGRKRALSEYDWSTILKRYTSLWEDLAERRRSDPKPRQPLTRRRRPDRPDPFAMFSTYPTSAIRRDTQFRRCPGIGLEDAIARRALASTRFGAAVHPSTELIADILRATDETHWSTFAELQENVQNHSRGLLPAAFVWLTKVGVLMHRHDVTP